MSFLIGKSWVQFHFRRKCSYFWIDITARAQKLGTIQKIKCIKKCDKIQVPFVILTLKKQTFSLGMFCSLNEFELICNPARWNFSTQLTLFHSKKCTTIRGIFLPKLFWLTVRKNCSSDWEKLLKFETEGREFSKFLRLLKQMNLNSERLDQFLH